MSPDPFPNEVVQAGRLAGVVSEISVQSKVEFNYADEEEAGEDEPDAK
jgi:hypothetical protein